jgi:hypothetical protein
VRKVVVVEVAHKGWCAALRHLCKSTHMHICKQVVLSKTIHTLLVRAVYRLRCVLTAFERLKCVRYRMQLVGVRGSHTALFNCSAAPLLQQQCLAWMKKQALTVQSAPTLVSLIITMSTCMNTYT